MTCECNHTEFLGLRAFLMFIVYFYFEVIRMFLRKE